MPRLLLVRHGTTEFNSGRRFLGHSDIDLSELGRRQVERLRDYLADEKLDAVYASDLKRTVTTAQIITKARALEIVPCPELREMNYGVCEGLTFAEIGRNYPDVAEKCVNFTVDLEFPEGEKFRDLIERSSAFLEKVKPHKQSDVVLVVSHNGPLKVLICQMLNIGMQHWNQIRIDVASLSIVDISPRGAVLSRLNDTSFLKGMAI
jgi:broad specificity phosphatase PhoE